MKTKTELLATMRRLYACSEASEWVKHSRKRTFASIWSACERGDWMLWLAAHLLNRDTVVRAACLRAREALVHVPATELRPLRAIETAEAWARGEATIAEVQEAAEWARRTSRGLAWCQPRASYAAARAAYAALAASARSNPAYSVCAMSAASLRRSADLVRSVITPEMFERIQQ